MEFCTNKGVGMLRVYRRWKKPLIKTKIFSGLARYGGYLRDWWVYSHMEGAEPLKLKDSCPYLFDRTAKTKIDTQYFYQDVWAFQKIFTLKPQVHVDVGSSTKWVSLITVITKVQFIDIRPLDAPYLENIECIKGSILEMPFPDNSLNSISCLNVAEHIGLGRYGDPLDPLGTKKAAVELKRCLAPGGNLLFSLPIGEPRVCFNAHRIHAPRQILEYFDGLKLLEFSCTDDDKRLHIHADLEAMGKIECGCGYFWFTK